MDLHTLLPGVVCALAVAVLVAGHAARARVVVGIAKLVASAAFVALALAEGAAASGYGRAVLAGLLLSFAGDAALLRPGVTSAFYLGMAAFASAHLAYSTAFALLGVSSAWLLLGAAAAEIVVLLVLRFVAVRACGSARRALVAYMFVASVMLSLATGAFGAGASWLVLAGAWAFGVSDVFVARHRFGTQQLLNKALGLPLYYAAQIALALSVAQVTPR